MSYKLNKPITDIQTMGFTGAHQTLNYYEDEACIVMYEEHEKVINGVVIDISNTEEYKVKLAKKNDEKIKAQIAEVSEKLPRAISEVVLNLDGRIKNGLTGETWLEYYENQIAQLRAQLQE